jgi:uncharacterized protein with von Willebrand factor type A (vWA) domain
VPIARNEKKQIIIIVCDFSGSMGDAPKQKWVNAILIDRLRHVAKGEAEIYFSFFVSNPDHLSFTHLKDAKDVKEFWKHFSNRPNGSLTDIGRIVSNIAKKVAGGCGFYNIPKVDLSKTRPEILIINDGEDRIGYDSFPYKVNAISIFKHNTELEKLCVNSGGKQIVIKGNGEIKGYSEEGAFEIYKP